MGGEILAFVLVALIVAGATVYIVRAKKSGRKCIGCPDANCCSRCGDCSTCGGCQNKDK